MKVILVFFLTLCLTFEACESHRFHPWAFMNRLGNSRPKIETTPRKITTKEQMVEPVEPLVPTKKDDRNCQKILSWTPLWLLQGCNFHYDTTSQKTTDVTRTTRVTTTKPFSTQSPTTSKASDHHKNDRNCHKILSWTPLWLLQGCNFH